MCFVFFLFLVSHFTDLSSVFKKKARVEKEEWHPDARLCAESLCRGALGEHLAGIW